MPEAHFWKTTFLATLALGALGFGGAVPARADDWKIVNIEGDVLVFFHGQWNPLRMGDIVADDAVIRSLANGTALFTRDRERILIAPDTQIQIYDRMGQRYTTVVQRFGTVGVEANIENVRHFEVRTPYLAAVVKGTIFGVHSDAQGAEVSVRRGEVGVSATDGSGHADVHVGQSALKAPHGAPQVTTTTTSSGAAANAAAAAASAAAATTAAAAAATPAATASASVRSSAAASGLLPILTGEYGDNAHSEAAAASGQGAAAAGPSGNAATANNAPASAGGGTQYTRNDHSAGNSAASSNGATSAASQAAAANYVSQLKAAFAKLVAALKAKAAAKP